MAPTSMHFRHAVALWLLVPLFAVRRLRQWWEQR